MAVVYRCVGILTVDVAFFWNPGVFHSQDSFPSTFRPRLWETYSGVVAVDLFAAEARSEHIYSDNSWGFLPQTGTKNLGKGILRMEGAGISKEEDDIDSQDSNTPIDHGHLARNCLIKIITPAVKASVISISSKSQSPITSVVFTPFSETLSYVSQPFHYHWPLRVHSVLTDYPFFFS